MLVQDIAAAVTSLGEACELLSAEFGETAPECAEAYFYYGKALLEMARMEAGVIGGGLEEEGESSEDQDEDDDDEEPSNDSEAGDEKEDTEPEAE